MKKGDIRGLAIGVVRWSEDPSASNPDIEFGSWGIMSEQGANVTPDTLFNIGSCSKAFLAVSVGVLIEDFRLDRNNTALPPRLNALTWDTRLADLLSADEWGLTDEWATKEATIGDILSHVSGLPRHDFAWGYTDSVLDIVKRTRYLKTTHGLRQQWDYNNQMYILVAHVIERYSGMSYTQFANERIFDVLGMNATTFSPSAVEQSGHLSHLWSHNGRRIPMWFGSNATEMVAGPGGVITSARDMTKWIAALLSGVTNLHPQDNALRSRVLMDVTTARSIVNGRSSAPGFSMVGYGMGWFRQTYLGNELVYHAGAAPGFRAKVVLLPWKRAGVVVIVNSDDTLTFYDTIATNLVHSILGLPLLPESESLAPMHDTIHAGVRPMPAGALVRGHAQLGAEAVLAPARTQAHLRVVQPEHTLLDLEAYAGMYTNGGYGNLTLCAPSTTSAYCDRVRAAFAFTHNGTLAPTALLSEWTCLIASHVRLTPLRDAQAPGTFRLDTHFLFPGGYGEDRSPFDYEMFLPHEFGYYTQCEVGEEGGDEGCGVFLTAEAYMSVKEEVPLREQADVWFEKVA